MDLAGVVGPHDGVTRVDVESATTLLTYGDVDVRAIAGQDAGRRPVGVGKDRAHDAAISLFGMLLFAFAILVVFRFITLATAPKGER